MNDLLLQALAGKNDSGRPPIWLMRQAGRYLPSYNAMRKRYSFLTMCKTPELAAEVTLLPFSYFNFDAAIVFSDILVVAEALGLGLRMEEKIGPIIERPIKTAADIDTLPHVKAQECLDYVANTIELLIPQLKVPLLGFAGAPFTVASYLIEGKSSLHLTNTKKWMMHDPQSFHKLLDRISELTIDYLLLQIKSGVHAVQLFDSWAHQLAPRQFKEFSASYMQKIVEGIKHTNIPTILFSRASALFASDLAAVKPTALSIDWSGDLPSIRKKLPTICLQGNIDPFILYGSKETISSEVTPLLTAMKKDPAYIFNLGHGIQPDTPLESVQHLLDLIHA